MTKYSFDIKVLSLNWLEDCKSSQDLCVHGEILVRIGEEIILEKENGEWTLSATALYSLRSLHQDYTIGDYGSQVVPCCAHSLYFNKDGDVLILGCPTGIDWHIKHIDKNTVEHTSLNGSKATIDIKAYRKIVKEFAQQVKDYYTQSEAKELPADEDNREAYLQFWAEFDRLLNDINQ